MHLKRITKANGLWDKLADQWRNECEQFGEALSDFATPSFQRAEEIAAENGSDADYGIFGCCGEGPDVRMPALMHLNRAGLPRTKGLTVRCLWILLSPRYDYTEVTPSELAEIATGILYGCLGIAQRGPMHAQHVKVHIGNAFDREVFAGMSSILRRSGVGDVSVRGNWLELQNVGKPIVVAA